MNELSPRTLVAAYRAAQKRPRDVLESVYAHIERAGVAPVWISLQPFEAALAALGRAEREAEHGRRCDGRPQQRQGDRPQHDRRPRPRRSCRSYQTRLRPGAQTRGDHQICQGNGTDCEGGPHADGRVDA